MPLDQNLGTAVIVHMRLNSIYQHATNIFPVTVVTKQIYMRCCISCYYRLEMVGSSQIICMGGNISGENNKPTTVTPIIPMTFPFEIVRIFIVFFSI